MGMSILLSLLPIFAVLIAVTFAGVGVMALMANKGGLSGGFEIRGFVGLNGHGKTLALVTLEVAPAFEQGIPVVSNLRLYPASPFTGREDEDGFPVPSVVQLVEWQQLLRIGVHRDENCELHNGQCPYREVDGRAVKCSHPGYEDAPLWSITGNKGCVLVLDEITNVLPSRQFASIPGALIGVLNQLRKLDCRVVWSAPNWARADVILREVTQAVTVCSGSFPDTYQRDRSRPLRWKYSLNHPRVRDEKGNPVRVDSRWLPYRLFKWTTFDASLMDEFTYQGIRNVKPFGFKYVWRPHLGTDGLYDTREHVGKLSHVDAFGTCVICDGRRSQPSCSCGTHGDRPGRKPAGRARPAGVTA